MNWPNFLIAVGYKYPNCISTEFTGILDIKFFLLTNLPLSFSSLPITIQAWSLMFLLFKSFIFMIHYTSRDIA